LWRKSASFVVSNSNSNNHIAMSSPSSTSPLSSSATWIEQQKKEILERPVDPLELTISLWTDRTLKRQHYACGGNYITLDAIPLLCIDYENAPPSLDKDIPDTLRALYSKLSVLLVDVTRIEIDAIVNAANEGLLGGGGVDEAIHKAAGPLLQRECASLPTLCMTGHSVITKGYRLPASYCIHTVGPYLDNEGKPQPELLKSCYTTCLDLMRLHGLSSIAFPSISTGFYGFPHQWAADIAVGATVEWLDRNRDYRDNVSRIVFALFHKSSLKCYHTSLSKLSSTK